VIFGLKLHYAAAVQSRLVFALLLVLALGACRRKKPAQYPTYYSPTATVVATAPPPTATQTAPTQVSDADRAAARDLFTEGATLQGQGKYAEALDRFTRSNAVFPAPTTALRMAQCQVALGRLVAGGEGFRAIVNLKLPQNAPQAFFDAQTTAANELAQLEPRIPRLTVRVFGQNIQNLQVLIDGQPLNLALLGAPRPIDPGTHKIVATAIGLAAEQTVEVKEHEQKEVKLQMVKR
jgi:hypothetical protein